MNALRIEILRDPARFASLAGPWTALWARTDGSVFQSHGWIAAWWRAAPADGRSLLVALAWDGDYLAAAMPLSIRRERGLRVLEWAAKAYTDYCDLLVAPGRDGVAVAGDLWSAVSRAGGFDLAYLSHLPPGSPAFALEDAPRGRRLRPSHRTETSLRVRSGAVSGDVWFEALTKKARQNHRRGWKVLDEHGAARFRLLGADEPLGPLIDRIATLKTEWLVRTGQTSTILADEAAPLRAQVEALAASGRLRAFVIELDGVVVAASINFVEHGRLCAYVTTYDFAFERASVGMVLMVEYMKWAFDRGIGEIDFLCGAEEFKTRFATASVPLASLAGGRTLAGRAAVAVDGALHRWRTARAAGSGGGWTSRPSFPAWARASGLAPTER